jgi:hypothetical protein
MPLGDWASQVAAMERRIECLEDVRASRIVPTPGHRDIEVIHIIAEPGRRPKHIVRDVESLLFVDFGCPVDYRKISLVQISEENLTTSWAKRPRLISVEDISQELSSAKACLRVAKGIMVEAPELELKGMERISITGRDALFCWVTSRASSTTHELLGACFFRQDELTTAASAVLDAINRRCFGG